MKNKLLCSTLIILLFAANRIASQEDDFKDISWERERIAAGLVWKHAHALLDDTVPQNINILIINTGRREISLLYDPSANVKTSTQARRAEALAAVNAGFFNIKNGGSATYIKVGGSIIDTDTALKWKRAINMNGSLIIKDDGSVDIMKARENSFYDTKKEFTYVLVTGPMLAEEGLKAAMPESSLVISRHPRTSVGKIGRRKVLLLTVDGRTAGSHGMTLPQLAGLMISLGCESAVNLDGGGSTTMYIKGKPYSGVVNMPCDNKIFDHEGERAVSDIIIVK